MCDFVADDARSDCLTLRAGDSIWRRHNNKLVCPVLLARALPHLHKTLRHHPHGGGEFLGRPSSRSLHIVPPRHAVVPRRRGEVVDMYVDGGSTRLHWRSRG